MKKKWRHIPIILCTFLLVFTSSKGVFAEKLPYHDEILSDYEFDFSSKYIKKLVFKKDVEMTYFKKYHTIGLYYHDTKVLKSDIPLVFITKVSKKDWDHYDLESWTGPHGRADLKGDWVYVWFLPGEHPYEPYGLDTPEAKEYLAMFNEIYEVLENSSKPVRFKDVQRDHFAYEAILWAKEQGIVNGYSNGTFKPNDNVTEAQFASMLANFFHLNAVNQTLAKQTPNEAWSDDVYNSLAAYGVPLNGYFDNTIRNQPVK